ncbi:minichromosome maintenance domain-containing protein 2 isoform X2 [Syngnathoides biaculeatus]|uniref:minichromosome maintenance domain-containing protein 2 isoform X2 n=1 Tax=Syngnathoides biaculeatus TaxID=300417 RepID=UPI002ADD5254|nr:minichromosome maintenance domain-containing protein 2 isoform X2 [Syngnathoides biaculeatus]
MTNIFPLKKSVLSYLIASGGLGKLADDCKSFKDPQHNEAVYRICISVNPSDVIEVDPELGNCILHDPLRATALFQSVCFTAMKKLAVEKIHTECQVNVILKLTHLPPFPEYTLDLASFPRTRHNMRPVVMEGLVIATTRVTKYTRGARFLCSNPHCPFSSGFHTIRVHVPGATESTTLDKQLVELIHVDALNVLRTCQQRSLRYQSVTLFLRDELCNAMSIGQLYRVIGVPAHVHWSSNVTWSVEANGVQPWEPEYPHKISGKFKELFKATRDSPWKFSATVTHCFGLDVAPPGLFNTLKLSLLLSLVQTGADGRKNSVFNLDLLVTTDDKLILDRLMAYGLSLARRGVRHSATGEMFASLSRDEHGAGTANIHAGSALLAAGGVCLLGDLSAFAKDKLDAIQSALDSRTVSVFIPGKKYGEDVDQQLCFPVSCSFWALTDSTHASRRSGRACDTALGAAEMGAIPPQLADSFGLVVQCTDHAGKQAAVAQTVHTLQQVVQPGLHLYPTLADFSSQDYKDLLSYAQSLQVDLSAGAQLMIHGYYMASRTVRSLRHSIKMSMASIKLLISLAEAHCKLSLRQQVLEEDAVIAVLLCENSLTLKHGASVLVLPPDVVFPSNPGDAEGLLKRDQTLKQLHQEILRFICTYAPRADSHFAEEE